MNHHIPLPKITTPLRVYYLIEVKQKSVGHQMLQNFLNSSTISYRSLVADSHVKALNELVDESEFRGKANED